MTKILLDNDWKTGYAPCDDAIGKAVIKCVQKKLTLKEFFTKYRGFRVDFYPEAEIAGDTFQKIFYTLEGAGFKTRDITLAFAHVQSSSLFDQVLEDNPTAEIKFNAVETRDGKVTLWPYEDSFLNLKLKATEFIKDTDGPYLVQLFKVAVIKKDPDEEKYTLLLEDVQGKLEIF